MYIHHKQKRVQNVCAMPTSVYNEFCLHLDIKRRKSVLFFSSLLFSGMESGHYRWYWSRFTCLVVAIQCYFFMSHILVFDLLSLQHTHLSIHLFHMVWFWHYSISFLVEFAAVLTAAVSRLTKTKRKMTQMAGDKKKFVCAFLCRSTSTALSTQYINFALVKNSGYTIHILLRDSPQKAICV